VSEPRASEVEMAVEKPKRYVSPGNDEITAELILAGGRIIHYEIHEIIKSCLEKGRTASGVEGRYHT
jgi:hypothetical protein